jgi:predicted nucleotidyltransferase
VGSFAHGLNVPTSDHDFIGIYLDSAEAVIGIDKATGALKDSGREEGVKASAGDTEGTFYSLRKYAKLAADGNPTVLTLLFTRLLFHPDEIGLRDNRQMFLSRRLAARHIGYANGMEAQFTGKKAPRTNRPELIAKHGWDTKAGMHTIRLLIQGYELLTTGAMTLPMADGPREFLMAVRNGEYTIDDALEEIALWRRRIQEAEFETSLPNEPDYDRINDWLIDIHTRDWGMQ